MGTAHGNRGRGILIMASGERTTVVGPPGTGKTTYLAGRDNPTKVGQVEKAVDKFGEDRVIVASLTKTAAVEISSRLVGRGININQDHVGTLHAICYRALGRPPLVDKTIPEFNETYHENVTPANVDINDSTTDDLGASPSDTVRSEMDLLRVRRVDRSLWRPDVERFASRWEQWKAATGTVDFVDMIEQALDVLPDGPSGSAGAIFYDEAQDGSRLELDLLKQWSRHADHTVIVGDVNQALYSWRGASVKAFLEFSDRKIVLGHSYRLPRAVWAAASAWVEQIRERFRGEFKPRDADGALRESDATMSYPEDMLSDVQADLDRGKSVMILASCSYMLRSLIGCLKARVIPFHNPYRVKRGDWNPLRISRNRASAAGRILDFASVCGPNARPWRWSELYSWASILDSSKALVRGAKTILTDNKALAARVSFDDLTRVLRADHIEAALRGDLEWYAGHVLQAKRKPLEFPLRVAQTHGVQTLAERPRLVVGTIHSVKGGEADVVYLWPDLSPSAYSDYDDHKTRDGVLRTFYVGMTRAREELVLCAPSGSMSVEWGPSLKGRTA